MEPYDVNKPDRIPRTLECTHVLCTGCIKKLVGMKLISKIIECPMRCPEMTNCSKGLPKQSFAL